MGSRRSGEELWVRPGRVVCWMGRVVCWRKGASIVSETQGGQSVSQSVSQSAR